MTTNSIILYSFIPGTKAKAQEVNANFVSVADAIQADKEYVTQKVEEIEEAINTVNSTLSSQITDINTALDTKANIDASNANLASTTVKGYTMFGTSTENISETRPAVVVESYVSGKTWYRLWSDNWVEQGGIVGESNTNDTDTTITFPLQFMNTDYNFSYSSMMRVDQNTTYYTKFDVGSYISATATNIKIKIRSAYKRVLWRACGYATTEE